MKAAIYARVSTDEQKNNFSLPTQIDACREYAAAHSMPIIAEFREDYTGTELERPELDKLRELAADKQVDVVITLELDRLARGMVNQMLIESDFNHYGVQVQYVLAQYDDSPEGQLNKNLRASIAEYERTKMLERMRRGKQGRLKAGYVLGGGTDVYGYVYHRKSDKDKGHFEVVDSEAATVHLIFDLFVTGTEDSKRLNTRAIARYLSDKRIPTRFDMLPTRKKKKRSAGFWSEGTVKKILKNEMYAGVYYYNKSKVVKENGKKHRVPQPRDKWISVSVPAIISHELWQAAQDQLKANQTFSSRNTKHEYLLRGRVTCGSCGSLFSCNADLRTPNKRYYYRCGGTRKMYSADLQTVTCRDTIRVEELDALVWDIVWQILQDPDYLLAVEQKREAEQGNDLTESRLQTIEKEVTSRTKRRTLLLNMRLAGEVTEEDYRTEFKRINKEIEQYERDRTALVQKQQNAALARDVLEQVRAMHSHLLTNGREITFEEKQVIIDAFNVFCTVERDSEGKVKGLWVACDLIKTRVDLCRVMDTPI